MQDQATNPDSQPSPMTPVELQSSDGTKLYALLDRVADAKGAALIVHGYAEHSGRYLEVAAHMNRAGLSTLRLDLRGHGRSEGARGNVKRFTDYVEDIEAAISYLTGTFGSDVPIALVCHSNGSLAGLRLVADPFRVSKNIRAAVFSSPFLGFAEAPPKSKALIGSFASKLMPGLALPAPIEPEILTHDPEKIRARKLDTLCHDVAGARWFTEAKEAQAWVATFAHRISIPTLWLLAGDDKLVSLEQSKAVAASIKAPKEVVVYEGFFHEVWNETDRALPLTKAEQWLGSQFSD